MYLRLRKDEIANEKYITGYLAYTMTTKQQKMEIRAKICSLFRNLFNRQDSFVYVPDSRVESTLMAKRAVEKDLGSAYCTDKWDMRLTAKACFSRSACRNSSGAKSRQICIEGTPLTVIGKSSRG